MCNIKRLAALLLAVSLMISWLPVPARAECSHHPEHTEECGFFAESEEPFCNFQCELCAGGEGEEPVPQEEVPVVFGITVSVKDGEELSLEVSSADTVDQLLQMLSDMGVSLSSPRVCFENAVLEHGSTMESYGIGQDSVLVVENCYAVTVAPSENGSVSASAYSCARQETVFLTVTPAPGYLLESLTAEPAALAVTDGVYSFEMPAEPVTVSATFVPCAHTDGSVSYSGREENHDKIYSCCLWRETEVHSFSTTDHTCICEEVERFSVSVWDGETCISEQKYPYGSVISPAQCFRDGFTLIGYADAADGEPVTDYDPATDQFLFTVSGAAELHAVFMENCSCTLVFSDTIAEGMVVQEYSHGFAGEFTADEKAGQTHAIIYSLSGDPLPEGLVLDSTTGVLSGIPAAGGTFRITVTAALHAGNYCRALAEKTYDLTIAKRSITVQAYDQEISWGEAVDPNAYQVNGLLTGDTASAVMTPSTSNVTVSGEIVPSQAVITTNYGNAEAIYDVTYAAAKLIIEPDTTVLDQFTEATVTSANEADILAVQDMMASAEYQEADEETIKNWDAIKQRCAALLEVISQTAAQMDALSAQAAGFDPETITSAHRAELEQLAAAVENMILGSNLTQDEKTAMETILQQVREMLAFLQAVQDDMNAAVLTIDGIGWGTVKSSDCGTINDAVAAMDALLATNHLTEEERARLEASKAEAADLLNVVVAAKAAAETENVKNVSEITAENVKASDGPLLEAAKEDLQSALGRFVNNYTSAEQERIIQTISRINGALSAIDHAEAVTAAIEALPASVEPDDEVTAADILAVQDAYNALTENEKAMVPSPALQKLWDLLYDLTDYKVVKGGNAKWTRGTNTTLVFTANGPYSKFTGIQVDGKQVSSIYYTAKSGSTIVTLSHFYIRSLSYGTHTIKFLYTDGETSAVFHTQDRTASPATGDESDVTIWTYSMCLSGSMLAAMFVLMKRKGNFLS